MSNLTRRALFCSVPLAPLVAQQREFPWTPEIIDSVPSGASERLLTAAMQSKAHRNLLAAHQTLITEGAPVTAFDTIGVALAWGLTIGFQLGQRQKGGIRV